MPINSPRNQKPLTESQQEYKNKMRSIAESKNRNWHPSIMKSESELLKSKGFIPYPGDHRPEATSVEDWRLIKYNEAQDDYPATGFGNKPMEVYDPIVSNRVAKELPNIRYRKFQEWLKTHPGWFKQSGNWFPPESF